MHIVLMFILSLLTMMCKPNINFNGLPKVPIDGIIKEVFKMSFISVRYMGDFLSNRLFWLQLSSVMYY